MLLCGAVYRQECVKRCSRIALLDFEKGVQLKANEMWLPFCTWILKGVKSHCGGGCLDLTSAKSDRSMTAVKLEESTELCKASAR